MGAGKKKGGKKSKPLPQQIRDVRRLLAKPDIAATVRVAMERQLAALLLRKVGCCSGKMLGPH